MSSFSFFPPRMYPCTLHPTQQETHTPPRHTPVCDSELYRLSGQIGSHSVMEALSYFCDWYSHQRVGATREDDWLQPQRATLSRHRIIILTWVLWMQSDHLFTAFKWTMTSCLEKQVNDEETRHCHVAEILFCSTVRGYRLDPIFIHGQFNQSC